MWNSGCLLDNQKLVCLPGNVQSIFESFCKIKYELCYDNTSDQADTKQVVQPQKMDSDLKFMI